MRSPLDAAVPTGDGIALDHVGSVPQLDWVDGAGFGFPRPPFTFSLWLGKKLQVVAELHVPALGCFFEDFKIKSVRVHPELGAYESWFPGRRALRISEGFFVTVWGSVSDVECLT
jgi:hypothetical protein